MKHGGIVFALKGGDVDEEVLRAQKFPYVRSIVVRNLIAAGYPAFQDEEKKIVTVTFL